ncbi:MAG: NAD(P)-binding domain-containing protein, partial [Ignavibacteria bacterium]|nr:NAD(P)-binding domain-containing protein [Ignavibacteria bacterium]
MKNIAIMGTGKVGSAFAVELYSIGYKISALADRNAGQAKILGRAVKCSKIYKKVSKRFIDNADIVIISVNDDNLKTTVNEIAGCFMKNNPVIFAHTSGIHSSNVFDKKFFNKKYTASVHPIQTIESVSYNNKNYLNDIYFGIEGGNEAIKVLKKIIT